MFRLFQVNLHRCSTYDHGLYDELRMLKNKIMHSHCELNKGGYTYVLAISF